MRFFRIKLDVTPEDGQCFKCGFEIDGDFNASINLENYPHAAVGYTVEAWVGLTAPMPPMRQEVNIKLLRFVL